MIQQRNYTTLPGIASGLNKVRWQGDYKFTACCPAHDDRTPSFIASDSNGKILVKCFAGCTQEEVIGALRDLGIWHTASRHQIDRRKRFDLKNDVLHHQTILWLADQAKELSEAERDKVKESIQFLKVYSHG